MRSELLLTAFLARGGPIRAFVNCLAPTLALLVVSSLPACARGYVPVPSDVKYDLTVSRKTTISNSLFTGQKTHTTYTITGLSINGNPIALAGAPEMEKGSVLVPTRKYGTMKVDVRESEAQVRFLLSVTAEQEAQLSALPIVKTDPRATLAVGQLLLKVSAAQLGEAYTLDGPRAVPSGLLASERVLGLRLSVLSGNLTGAALEELNPRVTDGGTIFTKSGYARGNSETNTITLLFAVPKTQRIFILKLGNDLTVNISSVLEQS